MSACLYLVFAKNGEIAGLGHVPDGADSLTALAAERLQADRDAGRVEIWRDDRLLASAG